jgi:hypothetical protein
MKVFLLLVSMLCALTAWPAAARDRDSRGEDGYSQREQRDDRSGRREEGRRRDQEAQREQLSREQREQLRRDIHDHGRDIYRERRGRR